MRSNVFYGMRDIISLKGINVMSGIKNILFLLPEKQYLVYIIMFLLSRVPMAQDLLPFSSAFFVVCCFFEINYIYLMISMVLGALSIGNYEQLLSLIMMVIITGLTRSLLKRKVLLETKTITIAVTGFISAVIPNILMSYLHDLYLFDILKAFLNGIIVFILVFMFRDALKVITSTRKMHFITNEEIVGLIILSSLCINGFGTLQILGFTIRNILIVLGILIFSYKFGLGIGAAVGVINGILMSISFGDQAVSVGVYAFCGLLAGMFKKYGRIGVSLGFVIGNAMLTIYLNGSVDALIYLKEIVAAVLAFLVIPQKVINYLDEVMNIASKPYSEKVSYSNKIKEITFEKLNKFSHAFSELSKTFGEIAETKVLTDRNDISVLVDRTYGKICKNCGLRHYCWDRNFYDTYQVMFRIIEKLEIKGTVDESDISQYFLDKCRSVNEFIEAINNVYAIFKVDMAWKTRMGESRGIVSQQLHGLSNIISNLALEINTDMNFKKELEEEIYNTLLKYGIKPCDIVVFENKWNKYEVTINHKGCNGVRKCRNIIEKCVSDILDRNVHKSEFECIRNFKTGMCNLKLLEKQNFDVLTGIAQLSKYEGKASGDSFTFINNKDGKFIVALSDGMGTGQRAAKQSKATIKLFEQFIEAGFDKNTSIKLINSTLLLKSDEDSFSTIDVAFIDLYTGKAEFIKYGAVPTFIKRDHGVEIVKTISLPAGVLSNIEIELVSKRLEDGNLLIVLSDGIIDAYQETGIEKIRMLLKNLQSEHPQTVADLILENAIQSCNRKPVDDMLVLVVKVWGVR